MVRHRNSRDRQLQSTRAGSRPVFATISFTPLLLVKVVSAWLDRKSSLNLILKDWSCPSLVQMDSACITHSSIKLIVAFKRLFSEQL